MTSFVYVLNQPALPFFAIFARTCLPSSKIHLFLSPQKIPPLINSTNTPATPKGLDRQQAQPFQPRSKSRVVLTRPRSSETMTAESTLNTGNQDIPLRFMLRLVDSVWSWQPCKLAVEPQREAGKWYVSSDDAQWEGWGGDQGWWGRVRRW